MKIIKSAIVLCAVSASISAISAMQRKSDDNLFDRGWSNGWQEGFACGISATDEEIEKVFPSEDDNEDEVSI